MKKLLTIVMVIALMMVSGCVHVRYNPATSELTYVRVGEQKIGRLEIDADGVRVTLTDQKASADDLIRAMEGLDPVALRVILARLGVI